MPIHRLAIAGALALGGLAAATSPAAALRGSDFRFTCTPLATTLSAPSTCKAQVRDTSTNPALQATPTGTVTFTVLSGGGRVDPPSCTLAPGPPPSPYTDLPFSASCSVALILPNPVPVGESLSIRGAYSGDGVFSPQTGAPQAFDPWRIETTSAAVACTGISLTESTCTATVTNTAGTSAPAGTVRFTATDGTFPARGHLHAGARGRGDRELLGDPSRGIGDGDHRARRVPGRPELGGVPRRAGPRAPGPGAGRPRRPPARDGRAGDGPVRGRGPGRAPVPVGA